MLWVMRVQLRALPWASPHLMQEHIRAGLHEQGCSLRWPLLHRRRSDEATTVHHYAVSSLRRLVVTTVDCFFTVWLASTRVKKMSH